jgi:hypothetical protein
MDHGMVYVQGKAGARNKHLECCRKTMGPGSCVFPGCRQTPPDRAINPVRTEDEPAVTDPSRRCPDLPCIGIDTGDLLALEESGALGPCLCKQVVIIGFSLDEREGQVGCSPYEQFLPEKDPVAGRGAGNDPVFGQGFGVSPNTLSSRPRVFRGSSPPQSLGLGKIALSIMAVECPSRASRYPAVAPAGPQPAMITSYVFIGPYGTAPGRPPPWNPLTYRESSSITRSCSRKYHIVRRDGMSFLEIHDLHVSAGGKQILKGVDLTVEAGRTAIIFGPNGSGKSTLLGAIAGLPGFEVTRGDIALKGRSLRGLRWTNVPALASAWPSSTPLP